MEYSKMTLAELREIAKEYNVKSIASYKREELISVLSNLNVIDETEDFEANKEPENKQDYIKALDSGETAEGILEILADGYGFLRPVNYLSSNQDIYVPNSLIRRFYLRTGDYIKGIIRIPRENERFSALLYVNSVNDESPLLMSSRNHFERLTPIYPQEKLNLSISNNVSGRIIDIICPIGKGQRGMIVAPPKTGKTTLLKSIAKSITENHKEVHLIILLIDERPEEVTDIKRYITTENAEVVYSTFDEQPDHHRRLAEMVLERGKRLAEQGKDIVILLDSITRLSRAYNIIMPSSGRTLSGGLDPATLYMPKKFFGAARNIEDGGSLTIIATALIDTGSKMDDVIFEEFKGTGNMELVLDRKLAQRRIFPAIDISKSSTRKDDLLLNKDYLNASYQIRKYISSNPNQSIELTDKLLKTLKSSKNSEEFFKIISKIN